MNEEVEDLFGTLCDSHIFPDPVDDLSFYPFDLDSFDHMDYSFDDFLFRGSNLYGGY